jgi:hypothetical protein
MVGVDAMTEDVAHLVGREGGDLEGGYIPEAATVCHRSGPADAVKGVVVGKRHHSDAMVSGQVSHLVGIAPAVTHRGMHVEIGQHDHSLPGVVGHPATT